MIAVKIIELVDTLRGFTIYNGDYNIFIGTHLDESERTKAYLTELNNIERGLYADKLEKYQGGHLCEHSNKGISIKKDREEVKKILRECL